MAVLAVDIGNTQTTLGRISDLEVTHKWHVETVARMDATGILQALRNLEGLDPEQIERVLICSVVPAITAAWQSAIREWCSLSAIVLHHNLDFGVTNAYDRPTDVGLDRLANACGAFRVYGAPVMAIDFGTATKLDLVDRTGTYRGGAIFPGLNLMAEALSNRTAQLPAIRLALPATALGASTRECLLSGIVLGGIDAAEGGVRRIWAELGYHTKVIVSGGFAGLVSPAFSLEHVVDADLTLKGIALVTSR